MVGSNATRFVGPPMLCRWSAFQRCEVVFGHRGDGPFGKIRLIRKVSIADSGLAKRTRAQALLELILIHPNRASDTDHAVRWNLALSDPKVYRISGDPEPVGNFPYLCKSRCHRQYLVLSSKPFCTVRGQEPRWGRKPVGRGRKGRKIMRGGAWAGSS